MPNNQSSRSPRIAWAGLCLVLSAFIAPDAWASAKSYRIMREGFFEIIAVDVDSIRNHGDVRRVQILEQRTAPTEGDLVYTRRVAWMDFSCARRDWRYVENTFYDGQVRKLRERKLGAWLPALRGGDEEAILDRVCGPAPRAGEPISLSGIVARAKALARLPYVPHPPPVGSSLS